MPGPAAMQATCTQRLVVVHDPLLHTNVKMHFSVHKYISQSTNSFNTDPVNAFAGSGIRSKFGAGLENG